MKMLKTCVLFCVVACALSVVSAGGPLQPNVEFELTVGKGKLTELNEILFYKLITGGKPSAVLFYSPDCPHCKAFMPTWESVWKAEKDHQIKIARINGDKYGSISDQFKVSAFPMVLYFTGSEGDLSKPYKGPRKLNKILDWLTEMNGGSPLGKAAKAKLVNTGEADNTQLVENLRKNF